MRNLFSQLLIIAFISIYAGLAQAQEIENVMPNRIPQEEILEPENISSPLDSNGIDSAGIDGINAEADNADAPMVENATPSQPIDAQDIGSPNTTTEPATASLEPVLTPEERNDVLYAMGGVGKEELHALKAVEDKFNLKILSATANGQFVSGTVISIYDAHGGLVFEAPLAGPYLYARLPAGEYSIAAAQHENVQTKKIKLKDKGLQAVNFGW